MRIRIVGSVVVLVTGMATASLASVAVAQTAPAASPDGPPSATGATEPASGGEAHRLRDRFAKANTTGDGHLTLAQAQAAGMRYVAKNFSAIDTDHKGYVTIAEIRTYRRTQHAGQVAPPADAATP